ncbi:MAG: response regulator [Bacteroidales bacterium]|nr:response regulator [Bacteroidales bacterium]
MLDGFSKNWEIKDYQQRYTTFTNLKPGTYTLKIKSTDLDGVWVDQSRNLVLIVKPPFWLTWWAFLVYTIVIGIIVYYIRKVAMFRITMKNQLHMEQVEREKQEEINQSKMHFFTNISHEIRTPLTMLLAPLEKLINSNLSDPQKKYLNYIFRNTKRLERMVNQLLELQKIENVQLKLQARRVEIIGFLKEIIQLFDETASDQKINISFEPCCDELFVWIDPEKMDKILFNLISNAIRFTPPDGLITVSIRVEDNPQNKTKDSGMYAITVSDTGKGISQDHIEKIFDRFYQVESVEKGINVGTGIGLHLARELVKIHHGTIEVKSREGFGSTFSIMLPLGKSHLPINEILTEGVSGNAYQHFEKPSILYPDSKLEEEQQDEGENSSQGLVLVVEDDMDILNYLHDELSGDYQVLKANNGNDGWKLAFEKVPDLIICDIMMPGIDGIELCKNIKTTIETSHIPVIMLTAKNFGRKRD